MNLQSVSEIFWVCLKLALKQ